MLNFDREHLSSVDNAWLRMDRPYNHMTISAVMILTERLDLERLRQHLETRWLVHNHFKQRPVYYLTGAYWETDTHFNIANHLRRVGLPGERGKVELEEFVSNLVSTPMDPTKPLWEWHLVEDYLGGSAVVMRIHHCYADGIALMHVLLAITDKAPGDAKAADHRAHSLAPREKAGLARENFVGSLFEPITAAVGGAVKAGRDLWEGGLDILRHPYATVDYARHGLGFASEAARLLLLPDDPRTRFRGELGTAKRVVWADPLPLKDVKIVGKALGCTVNDVLLSSVAGALRGYLLEKGDTIDRHLTVRAAVPVNLRPRDQVKNLGNVFGLVLLSLPLGIGNPLERLHAIHQGMDVLKESYQATLTFGLLGIMGMTPRIAQASAMKILSKKTTAVMTNVSGPREALYFAGRQLSELMFWVPQSGSVGMGVSIQSYHDRVHFGLITDEKRVRDPEIIIRRFNKEFEKLLLLTLMAPWGEPEGATPGEGATKAV